MDNDSQRKSEFVFFQNFGYIYYAPIKTEWQILIVNCIFIMFLQFKTELP
jgi:hypothetical protein